MGSQELHFGHKFSLLLSTHMEMSRRMLDVQIRNSKEMSEIVHWCSKLRKHYYTKVSKIMESL